ncbi:MAG: hypothetical protein HY748_01355 [Elusimicrobia bacterium]|nr:hypothetical protein [Elusimicrobiota bacterium]
MKKTIFDRLTATAVAAAVVILSPGVSCYEAAAQTIQRVPIQASGAPVSYGPVKGWSGGNAAVSGYLFNPGAFSAAPGGVVSAVPGAVRLRAAPASEVVDAVPASGLGTAAPAAELESAAPDRLTAGQTLTQAAESVPALLSPDTPEAEARAEAAKAFDALRAEPQDDGEIAASAAAEKTGAGSGLLKSTRLERRGFQVPAPAALRNALKHKSALLWVGQAVGMSALAALTGAWIVPAVAGLVVNIAVTAAAHYRRAAQGFKGHDRAPPQDLPIKPAAWAPRVALLVALFTLLDWGVKYMFLTMGLPIVYHDIVPTRLLLMKLSIPLNIAAGTYFLSLAHSSKPLLEKLDNWSKKHPVLGGLVKAALWVITFPMGVNDKRYGGDLAGKDPVVGKMLGLVGILSAVVIAAGFGNGVEGIVNGRVIDFIPVGRGRANIADFYLFLGMPLLWMGLDFLKAARVAKERAKPMSFKTWKYFVMPVLGMVAFAYSTMFGYNAIPMPAWYMLLFSVLFSVGILVGSAVVQRFVDAFNAKYAPAPRPAPGAAP